MSYPLFNGRQLHVVAISTRQVVFVAHHRLKYPFMSKTI